MSFISRIKQFKRNLRHGFVDEREIYFFDKFWGSQFFSIVNVKHKIKEHTFLYLLSNLFLIELKM